MSSKFDPQMPDRDSPESSSLGQSTPQGDGLDAPADVDGHEQPAGPPPDATLLALIGRAIDISRDYQTKTIEKPLSRSYRAWQNMHASDSKYLGTAWRGRSRLFVPKTRSAVRKNLATAAAALFATEDVVNISASHEDDRQQRATAATIRENINFRLTCASSKEGIPWYQISMGACLDSQLTGVSISKQFWEFLEIPTGEYQPATVPAEAEDGTPVMEYAVDPLTGYPALDEFGEPIIVQATMEIEVPVMRTTRDRPMIELYPIENAGIDPAAPWYSPAQLGRWFYMRHPMGLNDAKAMLKSSGKNGQNVWIQVSDDVLLKGRVDEVNAGSRRVREGGADRYEDSKGVGDLDIVWLQENFIRIDGEDWHFWSVGRDAVLSVPQATRVSYPDFDGERPYVFGVAQLDTHRPFPMAPVESWQPLQLELNEITNLRQDTLKRSIAPIPVVKRGKSVDRGALANRGRPDVIVEVENMEDIRFESTPGPSGASYTETSVTNALFDELSGVFSTSSVQSNRQLNETVGGMSLMSGAANAVSEFDLRMWIETWVEPVLRQVMHLICKNESDERLLAISGGKARAIARYDYMPTLSDFEQADVTLRVNAGIGALDPMQKLTKLKLALEMLAPMFAEMMKQGIAPDMEAIIEEVFGSAGFKDGRRFFKFGQQPPQPPQDPKIAIALEELKVEREKMQKSFQEALLELRSEEKRNSEDNATLIQIEQMRGGREREKLLIDGIKSRNSQERGFKHEMLTRREQADADRKSRIGEVLAKRHAEDRAAKDGAGKGAGANGGGKPDIDTQQILDLINKQFQAVAQRMGKYDKALEALAANRLEPPPSPGGVPIDGGELSGMDMGDLDEPPGMDEPPSISEEFEP